MKLKIIFMFVFIVLVGICETNQTYANSIVFCSDADKVYVSSEQVTINPEGIFIYIDGRVLQAQAIMQDKQGLYYLMPSIYWSCKVCGYAYNPAWVNYCDECNSHYSYNGDDDDDDEDDD